MLHPRARRLALLALAVAACSDGPTAPAVSGTYQLTRVNDAAIPAAFTTDVGAVTATGGTLRLEPSRAWHSEVSVTVLLAGAAVPDADLRAGTYTQSRDTVYFRDAADGSVIPAVVSGTSLVARIDGVAFEFRRR